MALRPCPDTASRTQSDSDGFHLDRRQTHTSHLSRPLRKATFDLSFLLAPKIFLSPLPQESPSHPIPSPSPDLQSTGLSCCIPCLLFLQTHVLEKLNPSHIYLALSPWRTHCLARVSLPEVTLGTIPLTLLCQD